MKQKAKKPRPDDAPTLFQWVGLTLIMAFCFHSCVKAENEFLLEQDAIRAEKRLIAEKLAEEKENEWP